MADERGVEHLQKMIKLILSKLDAQEGQAKIAELMESIGVPDAIELVGHRSGRANPDRCKCQSGTT